MEALSFQEALLGGLVTLARASALIERLVPRTRPGARALTALLVEGVVWRAGGAGRAAADAPAGVGVQLLVGAAVASRSAALTHALAAFRIEFSIRAAHICGEHLCREGGTAGQVPARGGTSQQYPSQTLMDLQLLQAPGKLWPCSPPSTSRTSSGSS